MSDHREDATASLDQAGELLGPMESRATPASPLAQQHLRLHLATALVYALFDVADAIRESKRG